MNPFWVTFYSYKGGVGRTLSMVNSAALLAQQGRTVLLVDFDLEAPGLDSFTQLGIAVGRRGVVEYFSDFVQTYKAPKLSEYIQKPQTEFAKKETVFVMTSGRKDREYNRLRDALIWSDLYDSGLGQLMIAEWKAAIAREYRPDYVFVDSRTGLTDVGGVCTLHLPDLVIALFALNRQNIDGVSSVIKAIEHATKERRPQVVTVATPIPATTIDDHAVLEALGNAQVVLGRKIDLRVSYNPAAALSERIFVVENPELRQPLLAEYKAIVRQIKVANTEGLDGLLIQAATARREDNDKKALAVAEKLQKEFADRTDATLQVAELYRHFIDREHAAPFWEAAFMQDHALVDAFTPLVNYYRAKRNYEKVSELCEQFLSTPLRATLDEATSARTTYAEALMALGRSADAAQQYQTVFHTEGGDLVTKFNTAEALRRLTKQADPELWKLVIEGYEKRRGPELVAGVANQAQAMHIAYACVGDLNRAKEMLREAASVAAGVTGEIFSVITYQFVSKEQFLKDNEMCLDSLERGELWDGMKLSTKSSTANPQTTAT
jgi:MinD-like ATPase involved in chromosome partitioning or flagellar assembly